MANDTELLVETHIKTNQLEERFDRHLVEIKSDFKAMMLELKEISQAIHSHENKESEKHLHINDRLVRLESDKGVLSKGINYLLTGLISGIVAWFTKHN